MNFFAVFYYAVVVYREDEAERLEVHRGNEHKVQDRKLQLRITIFSQLSNTGTGFPERLQNLCPWGYSKLNLKWLRAIRSSRICFQQEVGSDNFQRSLPI